MTRILAMLMALGALLPLGCADTPVLSEEERAQGWMLLFDGNSRSGWTGGMGLPFPERAWSFEDGTLHLKEPGAGSSIYSAGKFDNFEFRFEWKIASGGNTGVKYLCVPGRRPPEFLAAWRSWVRGLILGAVFFTAFVVALVLRPGFLRQTWAFRIGTAAAIFMGLWLAALTWGVFRGQAWAAKYPPGFEYQIIDDSSGAAGRRPDRNTGSLYDLIAPEGAAPRPPGIWNESRIVVDGNRVEHWLNATKVLEYRLGSPELERAVANSKFSAIEGFARKQPGYIELQNHGHETWFRNLKIRPISGNSSSP